MVTAIRTSIKPQVYLIGRLNAASDCFWLGSSSRPKRAAWVPATAVEMYIPCQTLSKRLGAYTSPTSRNHDPNLGAGGCREAGGEVACAPYGSRGGKRGATAQTSFCMEVNRAAPSYLDHR